MIYDIYRQKYKITDYILSMKLRGYNPKRFTINSINSITTLDKDSSFVNYGKRLMDGVSIPTTAIELVYRYHFDPYVRMRGDFDVIQNVDEDYVDLVEKVQERFRDDFSNLQIIIETNPTSNRLIGPIGSYRELPLFGLHKIDHSVRIPTIINTDDQGVFDTSLYNEYSLIYSVLKESKTSENEIIKYISNLADMSNKYVF